MDLDDEDMFFSDPVYSSIPLAPPAHHSASTSDQARAFDSAVGVGPVQDQDSDTSSDEEQGDYVNPYERTAFDTSPEQSGSESDGNFEPILTVGGVVPAGCAPLTEEEAPPYVEHLLPPEYRHIDPKIFFPEFERNKVLRFSRLFGAGREKSLPQIWKSARSTKRRLAALAQREHDDDDAESSVAAENLQASSSNTQRSSGVFKLNFAPDPPANECISDDEERIYRPLVELRKSSYRWVGAKVCTIDQNAPGTSGQSSADASAPADDTADSGQEITTAMWRFGPAQYWYDQAGVPTNAKTYNFGMKLRKDDDKTPTLRERTDAIENDPRYLPVMVEDWENDVIYDPEQIRDQVLAQWESGKIPFCGWIPTQNIRTYQMFMYALKTGAWRSLLFDKQPNLPTQNKLDEFPDGPSERHSIFPFDDFDLRNSNWEDDVILDPDNMDKLPQPPVLQIDFEDDPSVFALPDDHAKRADDTHDETDAGDQSSSKKERKAGDRLKSQEILGTVRRKALQQQQEEDESMASDLCTLDGRLADKDPFNLSNDDYYMPKQAATQTLSSIGASLIRHSIPAQNLQRPFFPTTWPQVRLRQFHRPNLKRLKSGPLSKLSRFHPVESLAAFSVAKERERQAERDGAGGEVFFMRDAESLSAKEGELVLFEYTEEHPPLMHQCGMAAKVKNYYKRSAKDPEPKFEYGETAFAHRPPFLGTLAPGETVQAIECNLFRAPVYMHQLLPTDFIVIRTKKGYFIRRVSVAFCVGQQCPLMEVPSPHSKRASAFMRDFVNSFIYRLFWASRDTPRRLFMEHVRSALPHMELTVKKRLKQIADYKRTGNMPHEAYWLLKPEFRLPSREEVASLVTPEQCCLHYCMLAAEQRLRDAGYGERALSQPDNPDDDADDTVTLEDEIKCAPWNTTRAFIGAMRGKWLLDMSGIADPTGCGQGFSYVKESARPPREEKKHDMPATPRRLVTGTDADLRKLPLKQAKEILREFGVKDEDMAPLTRWEIIHVIRTLSTEHARGAGKYDGMGRFARGNVRFSVAEQRAKYKRWCQQQFDLQNKVLSSAAAASSDEECADEDNDSDMEEMAQNFESIITSGTVTSAKRALVEKRLEDKAEEKELKELKQMLADDANKALQASNAAAADSVDGFSATNVTSSLHQVAADGTQQKLLRIYRTVKDPTGAPQTKMEVVSNQQLIDAYVKIRTTKDEAFIKHFANMDDGFRQERRMKKKLGRPPGRPPNTPGGSMNTSASQSASGLSQTTTGSQRQVVTCTACGASGHIRTNRACPKFPKELLPPAPPPPADAAARSGDAAVKVDQPRAEKPAGADSAPGAPRMVSLQGTKLRLNRVLLERAAAAKRKSLKLKLPRTAFQSYSDSINERRLQSKIGQLKSGRRPMAIRGRKPGIRGSVSHDFYYTGPRLSVGTQRRRADPRVTFGSVLSEILADLRSQHGAEQFIAPVNPKLVPDYPKIVKKPMYLQRIKMDIANNEYETREQFLNDLRLILDNSRLYNGDASEITQSAKRLFEYGTRLVANRERELMLLEKRINPLLDDDDVVVFTHILKRVLQACKDVPKSFPFHQPVDTKRVPHYLARIDRPMDLGTMERQLDQRRYTSLRTFLRDIEQIYENSERFNSAASPYTHIAKQIVDTAKVHVEKERDQLEALERTIQQTLQQAEAQADDSNAASSSHTPAPQQEWDQQERLATPSEPPVVEEPEESTLPYEGGALAEGLFTNVRPVDDGDIPDASAETSEQASADGGGKPKTDFSELCAELAGPSHDDRSSNASGGAGSENIAETLGRLGQLNADLELSDSDDESNAKRSRPHDYDHMDML